MSKTGFERAPLSAEGHFYVEKDICLACMAPHHEAPELMGMDEKTGCYFQRQPRTPEDLGHAINAIWVSCVAALRYSGDDPAIIEQLRAKGCKSQIDALTPDKDQTR